jgi:ATP-binding cassette subfamily B protein
VVLDRGQIVEVGQHEELLAREGAYFQLHQAQTRQAELDAAAASDQAEERV